MTACLDCYVLRNSGYFEACWKHATAAQRAAADRYIRELANQPHPMLAMLERKR